MFDFHLHNIAISDSMCAQSRQEKSTIVFQFELWGAKEREEKKEREYKELAAKLSMIFCARFVKPSLIFNASDATAWNGTKGAENS